eukprot:3216980-Prymnesium_polylepis.2
MARVYPQTTSSAARPHFRERTHVSNERRSANTPRTTQPSGVGRGGHGCATPQTPSTNAATTRCNPHAHAMLQPPGNGHSAHKQVASRGRAHTPDSEEAESESESTPCHTLEPWPHVRRGSASPANGHC